MEAYLALGANLGDWLQRLRAAVAALTATPGITALACSPVFETDAVASEPQPAYLNAALRIETTLEARALLGRGLDIEQALGRERPPGSTGASRTIDIDLLLYGSLVLDEPGLTLPHPRLLARPFVRVPLARVARRGLRHPVTGEALDEAPPDPGVRTHDGALRDERE